MKKMLIVAVTLVVCAGILSSCSEVRRVATKKVTQEVAKRTAVANATSDTCNAAMGVFFDAEETKYFGEQAGLAINKDCEQAKSWDECVKLCREDVKKVFQDAVTQAKGNEECVNILTDDFLSAAGEQIGDRYE